MLRRRIVLMVHGINSWGQWYDTASEVLGQHFHCWSHRYGGYRHFGFLRALASLRALVFIPLSLFAVVIGYRADLIGLPLALISAFVLAGLSLLVGMLHANRKREDRIHELALVIDQVTRAGGGRPHLIAHSYGTLLASQVLGRYEHEFDRIIFWGAVVDPDYNWKDIVEIRKTAHHVRNDVGRRDRVVTLIQWGNRVSFGLLGRLVRDVGTAGLVGFGQKSVVANEFFDFDHGTALQSQYTGVARYSWLPFLWGINPAEHRSFCREMESARAGYDASGPAAFDELLGKSYDWTIRAGCRASLSELIDGLVVARLPSGIGAKERRQYQQWTCFFMSEIARHRDVRVIEPLALVDASVYEVLKALDSNGPIVS